MLLPEVRAFPFSGLSRWPQQSARGGRAGIARRFILLLPPRRAGGGRQEGRALPGCRGATGPCAGLAGASAELAASTCEPWAARKSAPTPRPLAEAESHDGQDLAFTGAPPGAPRAAAGM